MNRNRRQPSGLEWVPLVSMIFGGVFLAVVVSILVFSGHLLGETILWGSLGLAIGAALDFLFRFLTIRRKSYWMMAIPTFIVVLVGVPALGTTVLSDWFVAVGAPGTLTDWPAAFEVYNGFIIGFPILAWARDHARAASLRRQT